MSSEFPSNRMVLWDRTPTQHPKYVRADQIVPDLYMTMSTVKGLLEHMAAVGGSENERNYSGAASVGIDRIAFVSPYDGENINNSKQVKPLAFGTSTPKYMLKLSDQNGRSSPSLSSPTKQQRSDYLLSDSNNLTIPFSIRPTIDGVLSFDTDATANLIKNLGKTICSSRDFSLRSCVRIRAAGHVSRNRSKLNSTIRYEAILPNVSFQAVKVNPIPVLSTPLSMKLTRGQEMGESGSIIGPQMGYMTLNQTRKIIPLLESDPSVSTAPMIGVWVSIPDSKSSSAKGAADAAISASEFFNHPLAWAACVRFLFTDKIRDKVYIDRDTFLVANFTNGAVQFFEVTKLHTAGTSELAISLNSASDFLCTDFTVDLSVDEADQAINNEFIMCKFRPLTRVEYIRSFRESAPALVTSVDSFSLMGQAPGSSQSLLRNSVDSRLMPMPSPRINVIPLDEEEEAVTPLPRRVPPSPSSAEQSPMKQQTLSKGTPGVYSSLVAAVSNDSAASSTSATFPAEIIMAQQMQLEALRTQVAELRELVVALGGQLPGASSRNAAPTPSSSDAREQPSKVAATEQQQSEEQREEMLAEGEVAVDIQAEELSVEFSHCTEINDLLETKLDSSYAVVDGTFYEVDRQPVLPSSSISAAPSVEMFRSVSHSAVLSSRASESYNPLAYLIPQVPTIKADMRLISEYDSSSFDGDSLKTIAHNINMLEEFSLLETDSILEIQKKYLSDKSYD